MVRTIARFDDQTAAFAAVRAAVSASFPVEDIHLHAICPDGTRPEVPVGVSSHFLRGIMIGALLAAPVGVYLALRYGVPPLSGAIGAGGTGAVVGATMGLGSWSVGPSSRQIPAGATGFVVAIDTPEGRAEAARGLLRGAGGQDASLQTVG